MFQETVKYSGDVIFVQPVCEYFGIEYNNQTRRINSSPLLKTCMGKNPSMLLFGDARERLTLSKQGFITWILQLNPSIVQVSLQEKLFEYQSRIFEFMFGSIQRDEETRIKYARLHELRQQKKNIIAEITTCENDIQDYLDTRFGQLRLDFSENPKN